MIWPQTPGPASASGAGLARAVLLLLVGALVMHWLCYLPRAGAGGSGAAEVAHSYLLALTPGLIAVAITAVAASLLAPFALRRPPLTGADSVERRAARHAAALLAIFLVQEAGELLPAGEATSGVDAVVGPAGWLALPLAFGLGLLAALVARRLDRVEQLIAGALAATSARHGCEPAVLPAAPRTTPLATLSLAFGLARRPPPPALS
ncbi:MAG: hypothetical protein ACRDLO_12585 [Solirubrobacterales bacterium]